MAKKINRVEKPNPIKLRAHARASKPAPAAPAQEPQEVVRFDRVHVRSYRQCRGTSAKILRALLIGSISPDVAKSAVQILDRILAANHAILLQQRLESVSEFLQMDSPAPEADATADLPDETEEPGEVPEEEG